MTYKRKMTDSSSSSTDTCRPMNMYVSTPCTSIPAYTPAPTPDSLLPPARLPDVIAIPQITADLLHPIRPLRPWRLGVRLSSRLNERERPSAFCGFTGGTCRQEGIVRRRDRRRGTSCWSGMCRGRRECGVDMRHGILRRFRRFVFPPFFWPRAPHQPRPRTSTRRRGDDSPPPFPPLALLIIVFFPLFKRP